MFRNKDGKLSVGKVVLTAVIAIVLLIIILSSYTVIPAGHTGVVVTFGKVSENVLQEGLHFKLPFVQNIIKIDNRVVKLEVTTESFSSDLQTISTVIAVNYRITKSMSNSIYKEVGLDFEERIVIPAVNESLKAVVAQYTASDLVAQREKVSVELNENLSAKFEPWGLFVEDLNIINWDFSEEYIAAIEAKQVAEQDLIKTRTEQEEQIVIAEAEARKKVIAAEAEAESVRIAAEAEAERIKLESEAQAKANKLLAQSVTPELIEYMKAQAWDGKLPVVMSDAGTFFSLDSVIQDAEQ